ncbi:hypothetical protein GCM10023116_35730 [Kistimonas scapharcae]|uniref:Copper chaperone PCu(A)C n=2 Tax=Kistimonas scapharcae TaxID=1036133 RepID=A0ABP8V6W1_9GAMM
MKGMAQRLSVIMRLAGCGRRYGVLHALMGFLGLLVAGTTLAADVMVSDARIRAMPPISKNTAAYVVIRNNSPQAIDLVAADVLDKQGRSIADKVELHTTRMENGLMKMEHLAGIRIDAGKQARLAPGGNHIMIMGLHQALTIGEDLVLSLSFSDGERVKVTAPVMKVLTDVKPQPVMDHHQTLMVTEPRVRAMPPGSKNTAAYLTIKNSGQKDVELVRIDTPVADFAEFHLSKMEDGVMKMEHMAEPRVPAGKKLKLQPGGRHIMLMGLKKDLVTGEKVPLELHFSNGTVLNVLAPVKKMVSEKGNLAS